MSFATADKARLLKLGCSEPDCESLANHTRAFGIDFAQLEALLQAVLAQVGSINWVSLLKLFTDLSAQNWSAVFADLIAILTPVPPSPAP